VTNNRQKLWRVVFWMTVAVILVSSLLYFGSGVGQSAAGLPAELGRRADGSLVSSPKAELLHGFSLAMRLERMLLYPLLLLAFQLSGGAEALRRVLAGQAQPWLARSLPGPVRLVGAVAQRIPHGWRQRLPGSDLMVILLFVLAFHLGLYLLYLPFNFYRSFVVGHQFGLSTLSAGGWLLDWLKSVAIGLVTNGLLWTGFFALMRLAPRRWPIPAGALSLVFSLIFVLVTPVLITPLFYHVSQLDDPNLQQRILALTARVGLEVDEIHVIDASSKTTTVNAYFTGFGGAQRIVLYDNLLNGYTPDQVEVVLAHELGHWYYKHHLLSVLGLGAVAWLGMFALRWLLNKTWRWLKLTGPADVAVLPFILAVAALVGMLTMPVENGISRLAENQADEFALEISQKPQAFIELFEQFAEQNLSVVDVPDWEKFIFYTHPPVAERIARANRFSRSAQNQ